eukprot:s1836_g6.t1
MHSASGTAHALSLCAQLASRWGASVLAMLKFITERPWCGCPRLVCHVITAADHKEVATPRSAGCMVASAGRAARMAVSRVHARCRRSLRWDHGLRQGREVARCDRCGVCDVKNGCQAKHRALQQHDRSVQQSSSVGDGSGLSAAHDASWPCRRHQPQLCPPWLGWRPAVASRSAPASGCRGRAFAKPTGCCDLQCSNECLSPAMGPGAGAATGRAASQIATRCGHLQQPGQFLHILQPMGQGPGGLLRDSATAARRIQASTLCGQLNGKLPSAVAKFALGILLLVPLILLELLAYGLLLIVLAAAVSALAWWPPAPAASSEKDGV